MAIRSASQSTFVAACHVELAQEAATVANAMRIPLPFSDPWSYVRTIVEQTAELDNSMLYDLRSGARTEVDFINGAVVAAGRRAAVPTPIKSASQPNPCHAASQPGPVLGGDHTGIGLRTS